MTIEDDIETRIYQMTMLHKEFAQPLNVVIIVKTRLETRSRTHVVLFSSDLDLPFDLLIDYYALRFQIEFNFRDAKDQRSNNLNNCSQAKHFLTKKSQKDKVVKSIPNQS